MQNIPVNSPSEPDMIQSETSRITRLKRLIGRRPYLGALLFLVYWLALLLALGHLLLLVLHVLSIHLSFLQANMLAEALLALIVILPITLFKWWPAIGFTRGIGWRGWLVCLWPIVLIVLPALLALPSAIAEAPTSVIVLAVILALLVGFTEEGMFRGLIMQSLLPKGIWPTVLLSTLIFGFVHLTNIINGSSWGYVVVQVVGAIGLGVIFAAIRLRTNSIWPTIFLHMFRDVAGLILVGINAGILHAALSSASLIVNGVLSLLFLLTALVLLRPSQVRKMKIVYGLVPEPVVPAFTDVDFPSDPSYQPVERPHL